MMRLSGPWTAPCVAAWQRRVPAGQRRRKDGQGEGDCVTSRKRALTQMLLPVCCVCKRCGGGAAGGRAGD